MKVRANTGIYFEGWGGGGWGLGGGGGGEEAAFEVSPKFYTKSFMNKV